jgi:hypothetical protein
MGDEMRARVHAQFLGVFRSFFLIALAVLLVILVGCGGSSNNSIHLGSGSNNSLLHGQYAFSFSGSTSAQTFVTAAGSFTADGNGNITSAAEDITFAGTGTGSGTQNVTFTGTYAVGSDNRGNALLKGVPGCATWQFTMSSNTHGFLTCFTTGHDPVITASGSFDLQDTAAFSGSKLQGKYVFGFSGLGLNGSTGLAGQWTMNGAGVISNGEFDLNDFGAVVLDSPLSGNYSITSTSTGRGVATINGVYSSPVQFAFYVVNATDLKFVETDRQPALSGEALRQAPGPFSAAGLHGGYGAILGGSDASGLPIGAGGVFTADGAGNLSGTMDENDDGFLSTCNFPATAYTVGTGGRFSTTLGSGCQTSFQVAMYPAANGTIQVVNIDGNSVVSGSANVQTGGPFGVNSVNGTFALNLTGTNLSSGLEEDLTGTLAADGKGNLTGALDINNSGSLFQGVQITSSTYTMSTNGRGSAAIVTSPATFNLQTYQVSPNTVLFLDIDQGRVLTGVMQK